MKELLIILLAILVILPPCALSLCCVFLFLGKERMNEIEENIANRSH